MKRRILVLSPFFRSERGWIDDFCVRDDLEFRKVPYPVVLPSWHTRGGVTPINEWHRHYRYVWHAMRWRSDCIVTSFPQLAFVAACLVRLTAPRRPRLIAWHFNLGSLTNRTKGRVAGRVLAAVDRFVVHASGEIQTYSHWLGLDPSRFVFSALQRGAPGRPAPSPIPGPYLVSLGSANRDYATLVKAVAATGIKTVIIASEQILDTLPGDPQLVKLHGLSLEECDQILAGAQLHVVPISL